MTTIENRAGVDVLVMGTGCRPATEAEVQFCAEITRLQAAIADLKHALLEMTDDRDSWAEQESARAAEAVAFMQERDALWADVQRYRWLMGNSRICPEHWGSRWSIVVESRNPADDSAAAVDAAIDAAIAGERK